MRQIQPYESSPLLSNAVSQVLALNIESLSDAQDFQHKIRIGFTTRKTQHWGGKCSKTSLPILEETGVAFTIIVSKQDFYAINEAGKWALLIHELHHIDQDDAGRPKLRRHENNFCELPKHDEYSRETYESVEDQLHLFDEALTPIPKARRHKKQEARKEVTLIC